MSLTTRARRRASSVQKLGPNFSASSHISSESFAFPNYVVVGEIQVAGWEIDGDPIVTPQEGLRNPALPPE